MSGSGLPGLWDDCDHLHRGAATHPPLHHVLLRKIKFIIIIIIIFLLSGQQLVQPSLPKRHSKNFFNTGWPRN